MLGCERVVRGDGHMLVEIPIEFTGNPDVTDLRTPQVWAAA
jgi:hypothetical protein